MALKGQAKVDYQRDYMRKRRGLTGSNKGLTDKLKAVGLALDGNKISRENKPLAPATISLYNPAIHKVGDKVLVQQGNRFIETIVPDLDADGHLVPV